MVEREGRTAIVTGAGKRVGAAIAKHLADAGWTVVAHVHHAEDPVPDGAIKVVADLADVGCADAIFAAAGGLAVDLLVNNAARFAWDGFGEFSTEEFDLHMAVNARAPALLIDRFARAHGGGDALVDRELLRGGQAGDGPGPVRGPLVGRVAPARDALDARAGASLAAVRARAASSSADAAASRRSRRRGAGGSGNKGARRLTSSR